MSKEQRRTGLGTNAFYQVPRNIEPEVEELELPAAPLTRNETPGEAEKPKKVRTTVTLYPETLATMEMLKVDARRQGEKATYSDILDEAILDLARKKGVALPG